MWFTGPPGDPVAEVLVPLRRSYSDYPALVYELCLAVADVGESRPESVLSDIIAVRFDTLRFRAHVDDDEDSIPLREGSDFITGARSLLTAAACSATAPRRYYPGRHPSLANEYLRNVRLGQTERGSYVVALLSPALTREEAASSDPAMDSLLLDDRPETAESAISADVVETDGGGRVWRSRLAGRGVVETLLRAVDSADSAVASFKAKRDPAVFDQSVASGLSANLCSALLTLQKAADLSIDLSVAWSPVLPSSDFGQAPARLLRADSKEALSVAAEYLRKPTGEDLVELVGVVTDLRRLGGSILGRATLRVRLEGKQRSVRVHLGGDDYLTAVAAHGQARRLRCTGALRPEGRSLAMYTPSGVEIE
jgi:hypothetical protein